MDKPNELDNQPKVSNDPATRLPEATRGHIQDILRDNPQAEALRRVKHKQALQGNTHNLRSGKYSKLLPQYLLDHLSYIDELQFVGTEDVREVIVRLLKTNMKRVALTEFRETEGQTLDPQLSRLVRDSFVMAQAVYHTPNILVKAGRDDDWDFLKGLNKEELEAVDTFVTALIDLTRPHYPIPSYAIPS